MSLCYFEDIFLRPLGVPASSEPRRIELCRISDTTPTLERTSSPDCRHCCCCYSCWSCSSASSSASASFHTASLLLLLVRLFLLFSLIRRCCFTAIVASFAIPTLLLPPPPLVLYEEWRLEFTLSSLATQQALCLSVEKKNTKNTVLGFCGEFLVITLET